MNRKDVLELKRRLKKDQCTFTKMCGCYVNGEKKTLLEFRETFLNLPDEEFHKYLEISKKVLSGGIGNNMLELGFSTDDYLESEKQNFLMRLKKSALKDDALLRDFYNSIIDNYDYTGNFLIIVYHDVYDVMTKTSDNITMDESEEVYEYIICAICPVELSKPGLGYFEDERKIKARIRDWIVGVPSVGFVFPGFIDRSSDVDAVMYYTKDAKDPHPEIMEHTLGCITKQTATIQKETFQSIIKNSLGSDEDNTNKVFTDIQENLNIMIEEYNEIYEDTTAAPVSLSKENIKKLLIESGVSDEATAKIEASYEETFGEDIPLAENLVDTKLLKANAQKKKEEQLLRQVEQLESKLEEVNKNNEIEKSTSLAHTIEATIDDENEDSNVNHNNDNDIDIEIEHDPEENYAVILHVKPDKLPKIKTELINGQRCIIIPINDNEQTTINGIKSTF